MTDVHLCLKHTSMVQYMLESDVETMQNALEKIEKVFAADGVLSEIFQGYHPRQEQIDLAKQITYSLYNEKHLLAEAGTGVGKSFAYLVAATIWALENDKTVLVSTNTLPLQHQLMEKDLPIVALAMEQLGYSNFRFELAKGRNNYICKRRLENFVQATLKNEIADIDLVQQIAIYSYDSKSGMRDDFPFSIPNHIWEEINGDSDDCFHQHSPFYEHCFIQNARQNWTKAHVIVANHALVLSDLSLKGTNENGVLPKYDRLLFDEGHRVEEVFSRYFERTLSLPYVENFFRSIRTRRHGWMHAVIDEEVLQNIDVYHKEIRQGLQPIFEKIAEELSATQERKGISSLQPVMELIEQPIYYESTIEQSVNAFYDYLQTVGELRCSDEPEKRGMASLLRRIEGIALDVQFILHCAGGEDWAHWIEKTPAQGAGMFDAQAEWVKLIAQPINAKTVFSDLFSRIPTVFLSATMATNKKFDFLARRLGLEVFDTFIADSPFDFRNNALLIISELAPDPRDEAAFSEFLIEGLKRILAITKGRTLVLFTSYSLLEKVGIGLKEWVDEEGLELLLHLPNTERDKLIQQFKESNNRILFGNDSFWEGIDIPGEALSCIILTKLPFANPSDPLVKAKTKWIEHSGRNSFRDYMVPNVILRTKQGVGRLIRTMDDRGAIIIMDSRILTKYYGREIIASLPPAKRGKVKELRHYIPQ